MSRVPSFSATPFARAGVLFTVLLAAPPAHAADVCRTPTKRHFSINTQSFVVAFADSIPNLTETQAEWWVLYAAKQWMVESSAGYELVYDGRTTNLPRCQSADYVSDGKAVVAAYPMGAKGLSTGEDICIDSGSRYVGTSYPRTDSHELDIVALLVHEFGHWLGLDRVDTCLPGQSICDTQGHVEDTAMDSSMIQGTPIGRTLCAHDALRMRNRHEGARNIDCTRAGGGYRYVVGHHALSWFAHDFRSAAMSYKVFSPAGAALVPVSASQHALIASRLVHTDDGPLTTTGVSFTRMLTASDGSLTSPTELRYTSSGLQASVAPAIAGKQGLALAAWPVYQDRYWQCGGITIARSADLFGTAGITTLTGDCTLRQPALAYDPKSGRFILAYVVQSSVRQNYADDPGDPLQDAIVVRTSVDGRTWSSPQTLDVYGVPVKSTDTPAIACGTSGDCLLTAEISFQTDPRPRPSALDIKVGSDGRVSIVAVGGGSLHTQFHVGAAASSGGYYWHTQWPWVPSNRVTGGSMYTQLKQGVPLAESDYLWQLQADTSHTLFAPRMAGNTGWPWVYTVFVK